jgi:hypothetical protein
MLRPMLPLAALALAVPAALAGVPVPGTPVGLVCVDVNTDECTASGFTPGAGYGFGLQGAFTGHVVLAIDAPGYHHTYTCDGVVAAGFVLDPGNVLGSPCVHEGAAPPSGLPLALGCTSDGVGVVACMVTGA